MGSEGGGAAPVVRRARGKVNLTLRVVGRRPPGEVFAGYHELDSLVVFADFGDQLEVRPAAGLTLAVEGTFATALARTALQDNLVLRAAQALRAAQGVKDGAAIRLRKELPVASGLGGGSADAAAAFAALAELWNLPCDAKALAALGLELGADLPICLAGRPALVGGIGAELRAAPAIPAGLWLVLANPGVPLATAAVFARRGGNFSSPYAWPGAFATLEGLAQAIAEAGNDLEDPARALAPLVGDLLEALRRQSGAVVAGMSGSGASCFALFGSEVEARAAARDLTERQPGWWAVAAPLLTDRIGDEGIAI
ncbi:MAG: 4-(cytidine 5'-diphospho)-2-C-methyl-D-erythritol kinase [Kiloniellales bacterium]